ncbi:MAG: AAA family ATPase [bacterium]|nr:AAA family ATPase [bacterium]
MGDLQPRAVEWLWPARIPIGKVSIIAGDPGLGKGLLTIDMAARITTGRPFPCVPDHDARPGSVLVLSAEDDVEDTVLPRLLAAEGDPKRVCELGSIEVLEGNQKVGEEPFVLHQVEHLQFALDFMDDPRMIVIDPVTAYLGRVDSHKNADVRAALMPLQQLAEEYRVAVVLVSHLNKGQGKSAYRVSGSLAFPAAARAAYLVVKCGDDPQRRLFLPSKNNLGPDQGGLAYRVEGTQIEVEGIALDTCRMVWEPEPVSMTADQALAEEAATVGEGRNTQAEDFVRATLEEGAVLSKELFERAAADGFSKSEVRSALRTVGAKGTPREFQGPWEYSLRRETHGKTGKSDDSGVTGT